MKRPRCSAAPREEFIVLTEARLPTQRRDAFVSRANTSAIAWSRHDGSPLARGTNARRYDSFRNNWPLLAQSAVRIMLESRLGVNGLRSDAGQFNCLCQREFLISLRRHLVAFRAVGGSAAAIARNDASLLAFHIAVDPGHP